MANAIRKEAQAFLAAWLDTRRLVQTINFNRFQQEGLSATQFIVLNMLGASGARLSAADLARRLNVDVTTTMRTGQTLATRGLLRKEADPDDRRRTFLALTEAGCEVHARIQAAFIDQVEAAFASMAPRLRAGLVEGLSAFVTAASSHDTAAERERADTRSGGMCHPPQSPRHT